MVTNEDHAETVVTGDANCPLPMAHDRFEEAHWFLHQMMDTYHHPAIFRYSTNAFLSALKAVAEMLRTEMKANGHEVWVGQMFERFKADPVLLKFNNSRNIVIHHRSLLHGSRIETGLFRGRKLKLASRIDVDHDADSGDILSFIQSKWLGSMLDEGHSALNEQLGVRRTYLVSEISENEDVFTASNRAWSRISSVLSEAHSLLSSSFPAISEADRQAHDVDHINLLLEMDIDPGALERWGWLEE
ncbi:hypothetical protein [Actinomadura sp. 9N215]|uniref:hypothetical protein n=1 Tax=Actinomadura sp. 9N215 TaxID=3375150 RepID=UPI003790BEF3